MASLKELHDKRLEFGNHLSNLLRFIWRCYWKKKQKKKKKKGKKGKKKKANKDLSKTMDISPNKNPLGSSMSNSKGKGTPAKQIKQITVKDKEGTIDLTSGEGGDAEFRRAHTEADDDFEQPAIQMDNEGMNTIEERDDDDLDRASDASAKGS